jgi:hypothetical protein
MRRGLLILAVLLALPVAAYAAYPGTNPAESPRANAPNDANFDRCEADNEGGPECGSFAEEQLGAFGFSPDSANEILSAGPLPHYLTGTRYSNCDQLDAQGKAANVAAEGNALGACLQIGGVRADTAHKYSTGDPDTVVAILDTGIEWQDPELIEQVHLNRAELPKPEGSDTYDRNGDGAFTVSDYEGQVDPAAGDDEADSALDGSDLISTFTDHTDADGNGYVDDIAGWDFFDDDNDPYDASSCCSAEGHGSDRAKGALARTNNGRGDIGMCPRCQLMPLRVWDTFVVPTDNYAMGTVYAAANGASVVEGAVGGLTNTQFARRAFQFADSRGVALMLVSSDINSANHNYPTNYNEAIYVAGSLYDTAPNNTCSGLPGLPGVGDVVPDPPPEVAAGCQEFLGMTGLGQNIGQPITTSFFRNSNLTQYGGKADIVLMGSTGSENTGQAAGAAGLIMSYGRQELGSPLSGNEVRQLLTMTAEDVLPQNTGVIGVPDKANAGWDTHFGYGRVNLAGAMARIKQHRIPPQAQIDAPDWFAPINLARVPASGVEVRGHALGAHGTAVGNWEVEFACGQDAPDASFKPFSPQIRGTGPVAEDGLLGTMSRATLAGLADTCNGEVANDAGRPAGTAQSGPWPADPYPDPDPERHTFQIRLTVHAAGAGGNIGRYRKTLHAYNDDGNRAGWPRPIGTGSDAAKYRTGSGGEASPRLFDVDGDNRLDTILPTSSGELWVLQPDGTPLPSFNGGQPVLTDRYQLEINHPVPNVLPTPHESLRVPAIGDIDGDLEPEIVATAGEHVYAWDLRGQQVMKALADRSLSSPCKGGAPSPCFHPGDRLVNRDNHIKRGFASSAVLADLDPARPGLEIVAGGLDQHVYAWHGDGSPLAGFPAKLASEGADGAEIVTTPAIADLDGKAPPEIVVATNEVVPGDPEFPGSFFDFVSAILQVATGYNPVYALHANGKPVDGWPVKIGVAAGDLLPLVLPGHDAAVIDADGGTDEVAVSAGTAVIPGGGARLVDATGTTVSSFESSNGNRVDTGAVLNLADYPSAGDILGTGQPQILKGGLTINGVVNLLAVNQNLPFNHVEQLWNPALPNGRYVDPGPSVPGYPLATDDFQLVSQAAVAQVGATTPAAGHQALVGTGLYQLHAYGPAGVEPAGWPKFTGGWTQATAAVGDTDGNGTLDVTTLTREGWIFQWKSTASRCSNHNEEWWTYHHDEHSTANYGHDGRPPGTPRELTATRDGGRIKLTFKAPGDDWLCGKAAKLRVLRGDAGLDRPRNGTAVGGDRDLLVNAGTEQTVNVDVGDLGGSTRLAILARDSSGNWGHLASLAVPGQGETTVSEDGGKTPGADGDANPGLPETGARPGAGCTRVKRGTKRRNLLRGTAGNDRLFGLRGNDRLLGKRGRDCLFGGRGNDRLNGGGGRDRMVGGPGRDRLVARGSAIDQLDCGPGRDLAIVDKRDVVRRCERVRRK